MKVRNTFIIFIVSGFWHGANWTFIVWGALNAIYFLPLLLTNNHRTNLETVAQGKVFPSIKELSFMLLTFGMTVFAWIFFRANNIGHAMSYISGIFAPSFFTIPEFLSMKEALTPLILVCIFVLIEWLGRERQYAIQNIGKKWHSYFRYALYFLIVFTIMYFGNFSENQFIYFQF
jgi:alginate O-acetyltransferase complex protein AlgI